MSFAPSNNWGLRVATLLLVPATLIVGSNFIANSKVETQATSIDKAAVKRAVAATPTFVFEADEEFEDDALSDNGFLQSQLPCLAGISLTKQGTFAPLFYYPPYRLGHSVNPRAPPAV